MKTKPAEDDNAVERRDIETPPRKKLKQARLPFQILTPGVKPSSPPLKSSNKRKLSETSDDVKVVKVIRPNESNNLGETKENVCSDDSKLLVGSVSKILPNSCGAKSTEQCTKNSDESPRTPEKNVDEVEVVKIDICNTSLLSNSEHRKSESNSPSENKCKLPSEESSVGNNTVEDVINLSDSENDFEKDLTTAKCNIVKTRTRIFESENKDVKVVTQLSSEDNKKSDDEVCVVIEELCNEAESLAAQSISKENAGNNESSTNDTAEGTKMNSILLNGLIKPTIKTSFSENKSHECTPNKDQEVKIEITHEISANDNLGENTPTDESKNFKHHSPESSLDSTQKIRKLTPKQLQKQLESAKKREEKEKLRQEREKKKAEEKEEKLRQKQEKEEQRKKEKEEKEEQKRKEKEEKEEQRRKEKEEKEELKKKEREEKERKKQIELELKNEGKRKKEGKMQAEAAAFTSFFLPKKSETKLTEEPKTKTEENFMPFEVKADMRLAPNTRITLTTERKQLLDESMGNQAKSASYLDDIRNKKVTPQSSSCTWAVSDFKNDVIILDDEDDDITGGAANNIVEYAATGHVPRPKLLQFWENRRPPYWGTWRKKSQNIGPKKPFSKDEKFFEYEVDSDDEWEEEEPGESLHGSDDEKESEDEYEVDNEFFVPHGYLSDEENVGQEDEDQSPEAQKTKLKLLELEFEEEMKQKTERIKPRLIGCIWFASQVADSATNQLLKLLSPYQAVYQDGPIDLTAPDANAMTTGSPEFRNVSSPTTPSLKKRKKFPEEAIPALIKLIHGNVNKREFLAREFLAYWSNDQKKSAGEVTTEGSSEGSISTVSSPGDIFKKSVSNKIKELATWIACPEEGPMSGRMCWYVLQETRIAHGLGDIVLPNTLWTYTFKPKRRKSDFQTPSPSSAVNSESNPKQLITKFTKIMSEGERKKQFITSASPGEVAEKSSDGSSQNTDKTQRKLVFPQSNKTSTTSSTSELRKKVPILLSGPRGQELPKTKNLLNKFIKKPSVSVSIEDNASVPNTLKNEVVEISPPPEVECVVLSD
ncbi:chromatin assembly factor 1 subunit A-like [Periplaneta americana]|uniref:chromatin assembly factor 1 subunit A-like n=1 Tax=Periplaneta americana TaxID=6978 RepID=UPI0037E8FB89